MILSPSTTPVSNLNIITYMKHNVPITALFVMSALNQYAFADINCSAGNRALVIVNYVLITVVDVIWTMMHCKIDFIHNYPHTGHQWIQYATIRSLTSVLALFSLTYFMHNGRPFTCFFDYNPVAANVLLYLSFLTIALISYLEHTRWKKLDLIELPELRVD